MDSKIVILTWEQCDLENSYRFRSVQNSGRRVEVTLCIACSLFPSNLVHEKTSSIESGTSPWTLGPRLSAFQLEPP
jgi:hypothetical protein